VLILSLKGEIYAQKKFVEKNFENSVFSYKMVIERKSRESKFPHDKGMGQPAVFILNSVNKPSPRLIIPGDLYVRRLGFICKKEWQFEKFSSIPFRFRLGSLDYTNYMEQKPNALKPGN
jgi:hypothetical protein